MSFAKQPDENPPIPTSESRIEALEKRNADLEMRLQAQSLALQQAQNELQALIHSISHDLRAPLRTINGFCKIVLSESDGSFDAETASNIERIAAGATRMGRLLDGMLRLSQVSRHELNLSAVDLGAIADEILQKLARSSPERQVRTQISPDLHAIADAELVTQALENLLGNAWKFTARSDAAAIEVGHYQKDGNQVFFVRDNGAGFDMRYASRLFEAFQRFNSEREFEGIGMGLCITRRIIGMHRGRIWAETRPNQGATFSFTLSHDANAPIAAARPASA